MLLNRDKIRQDKTFDLLTEAILERDQPRTADWRCQDNQWFGSETTGRLARWLKSRTAATAFRR
jgi:hypothetical protein